MSTQNAKPTTFDLEALRAKLAGAHGPAFWRSLDEVAETPEFQEYIDNEFTKGTSEWTDPVSRRRLMQLLGASLGLAGLTACTKQPPEKVVPYVRVPEEIVPGKPLFFATATTLGGFAQGVIVESNMGRPTKIEGNPDHPASLGATSIHSQAQTLALYDPDRAQVVVREGSASSWKTFLAAAAAVREKLVVQKGAGFRILTETVTSPSLAAQIRALLAEMPEARWHLYEPVSGDNARAGARIAFGDIVSPVYDLAKADVILALDSDFLTAGPGAVRYARDFSRRRDPNATGGMNRLYSVEACPTSTGATADHRLALSHTNVEMFARALASRVGAPAPPADTSAPAAWLDAVAKDLIDRKGRCVVIPGEHQSAAVHALAHAMNVALGNVGNTVLLTEPIESNLEDQYASLASLIADLKAGKVETLLVLGGNPVHTAPARMGFLDAYRRAKLRIRVGLYDDETAAYSHWVIPEAHTLECWGDARAFDGTVTLMQPLIAPLYDGKTHGEVLSVFRGHGDRTSHDLLKQYWQSQRPGPDFDTFWRKSIHDGFIAGSSARPKTVALQAGFASALPNPPEFSGPEIQFRPDPNLYDGRFANNGWLQELPRPVSLLVWDNAALISPRMAQKNGVQNGDVVELRAAARALRLPVWILPGHAEDSVTVHLGYGRTRGGRLASGAGVNANLLRSPDSPWVAYAGEIRKTGGSYTLATVQMHHSMEGRDVIRSAALADYRKDPRVFAHGEHGKLLSLYPERQYETYAWGMAIDLNACVGCNACTIACQAENNIAIVGKSEVVRGREMHWIRVDRYFSGELDAPDIHHQPVPCMHCEKAPCEPVCPVAATVHSNEGLNHMVYNRCVGTRYCANNCPYKVRRFNFLLYSDWTSKSLEGLRNPNVTVRSRGVMEKCTYCVQRISTARIAAELEGRKIKDGEVVTACQAVCPAQAIHFGDLNDPASNVSKIKKDPRNYSLLEELGTSPRTTYLAHLKNPNPALVKAGTSDHHAALVQIEARRA